MSGVRWGGGEVRLSIEQEDIKGSLPERPGIVTPLAPTTESMTPWAKTLVQAKAAAMMADEYCILDVFRKDWIKRMIKSLIEGKDTMRPALGWI